MRGYWLMLPFLAGSALAQGPVPQARLDTNTIRVGEQARLTLEVPYRVDQGPVNIVWPVVTDTLSAHIRVVHDGGIDTVLADRDNDPYAFIQRRTLTITSFDSGYWAIRPFPFRINDAAVESDPLLITVETIPVDTTQAFRDIKPIYEVPFDLLDWLRQHWTYLAGGAAVLALLILLARRLGRRREAPPVVPLQPELPLHQRMLNALDTIEQRKLWQQGRVKEYQSEVTDLLRGYVEERYAVPALERTTEELMGELRVSALPESERQLLGNILRLADMVKFAKYTALPAENEQLMTAARGFIQRTMPDGR